MDTFLGLFSFDILKDALIVAVPALICITVHELAHGYTAYKLGDNTAKEMGRLTLNPIKHIDIVGLAMILLVGFGWAKPVPVDMRNFKHPKAYMAVTAFAGPLSNLILAVIVTFIFLFVMPYESFNNFLYDFSFGSPSLVNLIIFRMILLNLMLAVFNLLPIPPLDGSKVVFSLLPENIYNKIMKYERYGMILLLLLVFSGRFLSVDIFGILVTRPATFLLFGITDFAQTVIGFFG